MQAVIDRFVTRLFDVLVDCPSTTAAVVVGVGETVPLPVGTTHLFSTDFGQWYALVSVLRSRRLRCDAEASAIYSTRVPLPHVCSYALVSDTVNRIIVHGCETYHGHIQRVICLSFRDM